SKKRFSYGIRPDSLHHLRLLRLRAGILVCFPARGILSATVPRDFQTKLLTRSQRRFTFGAEKPISQELKDSRIQEWCDAKFGSSALFFSDFLSSRVLGVLESYRL